MTAGFENFIFTPVKGWKPRVSAGWLHLDYEQSLAAPLRRPCIRFTLRDGREHIVMGQAPLFGRGLFVARVPRGTRAVAIGHGPEAEFAYHLRAHAARSVISLLPRALRNNRSLAVQAIGAGLIQAEGENEQALGFARGGIPFTEYHRWRREHWREPALDGLDAGLISRAGNAALLIVLDTREASAIDAAGAMLARQPGVRWRLALPAGVAAPGHPHVQLPENARLGDLARLAEAGELIFAMTPEVLLAPCALAQLAAAAAQAPEAPVLYADEDALGRNGHYHTPLLKPDWSPLLEQQRPYLGRAVFWRAETCQRFANHPIEALSPSPARAPVMAALAEAQVHHLRRVLVTHRTERAAAIAAHAAGTPMPCPAVSALLAEPEVAIVIANKNRLNLIQPCIESLYERSRFRAFEVVIVDNGSTEPAVHAFYRTLDQQRRARILSAPGGFNFSAMSNQGARASNAPWLIFLNNDIEVIAEDWIEQMRQHVLRPEVGTVGARLLFPNGRIQHAGVAVGLGGFADHLHHSEPADASGYLGRLSVPHELMACTGACLGVARDKFEAVGGFNEADLPVELNDIDLCLKLGARGWKTVLEPRALLVHHQSASRGKALLPFSRYSRERAYFRTHWLDAIRDDPYFHPALSDYSVIPMLAG